MYCNFSYSNVSKWLPGISCSHRILQSFAKIFKCLLTIVFKYCLQKYQSSLQNKKMFLSERLEYEWFWKQKTKKSLLAKTLKTFAYDFIVRRTIGPKKLLFYMERSFRRDMGSHIFLQEYAKKMAQKIDLTHSVQDFLRFTQFFFLNVSGTLQLRIYFFIYTSIYLFEKHMNKKWIIFNFFLHIFIA